MLGDTEYNCLEHVASNIPLDFCYLPPSRLDTQSNLDAISSWTDSNLMLLNEAKTVYTFFTRSREQFCTRLTVNSKIIEKKEAIKLLGVWLQPDCGWERNKQELCKKAYARMSMLTKLKYAGVCIDELIHMYKQYIRGTLEYCSVAISSSLTVQQSASLERCQAVALRIILNESYVSYSAALEMCGLELLGTRRLARCLEFSLKCIQHPQNARFFPLNPNLSGAQQVRYRERYKVNFSCTKQ